MQVHMISYTTAVDGWLAASVGKPAAGLFLFLGHDANPQPLCQDRLSTPSSFIFKAIRGLAGWLAGSVPRSPSGRGRGRVIAASCNFCIGCPRLHDVNIDMPPPL